MGWHNYTIIIHIVPVVCTWHGCQPRHAILSKEKYQETSQIISLCPIPWTNIERRVIWFEVVLFIDKYQNTIKMIWMCHNLVRNIERRVIWFERVLFIKKYLNTSQMIWMCPNPWEISKDGSDDLTVSSSLQAGRRNWYASSLYYMRGWVARYSMISDSGWTWQWVKESS